MNGCPPFALSSRDRTEGAMPDVTKLIEILKASEDEDDAFPPMPRLRPDEGLEEAVSGKSPGQDRPIGADPRLPKTAGG
jgi:hypothetical protein